MFIEQQIKGMAEKIQSLEQEVSKLRYEVQSKPMSLKDAAKYLGVSRPTLIRRMEEGLPFHKVGKRVFFTKSELDNYLNKN